VLSRKFVAFTARSSCKEAAALRAFDVLARRSFVHTMQSPHGASVTRIFSGKRRTRLSL